MCACVNRTAVMKYSLRLVSLRYYTHTHTHSEFIKVTVTHPSVLIGRLQKVETLRQTSGQTVFTLIELSVKMIFTLLHLLDCFN